MVNLFKITYVFLAFNLRALGDAIFQGRFFFRVQFINKKNILVDRSAVIERGSRLIASDPISPYPTIEINALCWVGRDVEIQTWFDSKVTIAKGASVQDRCKLLGNVYIGRQSLLAPDVFISSGTHIFSDKPYLNIKQQDKIIDSAQAFRKHNNDVVVEEDCWLGKGVVISGGVQIARGVIVAANSFVNKNIPPYEIWGGSPARFLKKRLEFSPPAKIEGNNQTHYPYFYTGFNRSEIIDGIVAEDSISVCLLSSESDVKTLNLLGEILEPGELEIWLNKAILFKKSVSKSVINEELFIANSLETFENYPIKMQFELQKFNIVTLKFNSHEPKSGSKFLIKHMEIR